MGFQGVAFLSSRASFTPHFLKNVLEDKAMEPPHVIGLWLGVGMCMLPVETLLQQIIFLLSVKFHGYRYTPTKFKSIWPPSVCLDIA